MMSSPIPDDCAASDVKAPAFQFRLAHLFGLTTLCAIAAALVAAWGIGTLPMSVGLIVAWLNWCGAFRVVQAGWQQQAMLWLAWGTFLLSLALPSLQPFSSPIYGWGAAWIVLSFLWEAVSRGKALALLTHIGLWYLLLNVANLLAAMLPLFVWRLRRGGGKWLAAALCLVMTAPWSVAWDGKMAVGYYVWCGSFILALVALPLRRWTMIGMVTMAALTVGTVLWSG